jgi:hypothetical protein
MAMHITLLRDQEGTAPMWTADRKLWLTEDGGRVVEDGDPDAASLYATPGYQVPLAEAKRLGVDTSAEYPANQEKPLTAPFVAEAKRAAQPTESPEALAAAVAEAKKAEVARRSSEAEALAGQALKDRAAELEIEGRGSMKADELRDAVAAKEAENVKQEASTEEEKSKQAAKPADKQRDFSKNK